MSTASWGQEKKISKWQKGGSKNEGKEGLEVIRQPMVPQLECSWMGGKERRWAGSEVGMGGLLFLACLAICPGVKMCTHRGCPWSRGGRHSLATSRDQWVRVSPGGGSHPSLGLPPLPPSPLPPPPPYSSTHCLICHCQVCLHRAARVKLALWKWERMFAQLPEPFEVRLKEHSSPHLEPMLITEHDLYSRRFWQALIPLHVFNSTVTPLFLI